MKRKILHLSHKWLLLFFSVCAVFLIAIGTSATYMTNNLNPLAVGTPVASNDAANKSYIDSKLVTAGGFSVYKADGVTKIGTYLSHIGGLNCPNIIYLNASNTVASLTAADCQTVITTGPVDIYYTDYGCTGSIRARFPSATTVGAVWNLTIDGVVGYYEVASVSSSISFKSYKNAGATSCGYGQGTSGGVLGLIAATSTPNLLCGGGACIVK